MLVKETENIQIYMYEIEIENTGHITNTYILKDKRTNKLVVIDPAFDGEKIKETAERIGTIESVIITHSHADHIAGLAKLVNQTDIKVYIHSLDETGLYDAQLNEEKVVATTVEKVNKDNVKLLEDKDRIQIGNAVLEVMHTPGHTKGSIVLFNKEENILFSGDTIFKNSYGRTDLITGSAQDMGKSLDKLFETFENIDVYPGHGECFNINDSKRKIKLLFAFKGNC